MSDRRAGMRLAEACTLAVGILGKDATADSVYRLLAADGFRSSHGTARAAQSSRHSVKCTLFRLRGAAVEVSVPGYSGNPARWRLTEASRAWLAAEGGDSRCAA